MQRQTNKQREGESEKERSLEIIKINTKTNDNEIMKRIKFNANTDSNKKNIPVLHLIVPIEFSAFKKMRLLAQTNHISLHDN